MPLHPRIEYQGYRSNQKSFAVLHHIFDKTWEALDCAEVKHFHQFVATLALLFP
jgi:hypothetical protein